MATKAMPAAEPNKPQEATTHRKNDWTKPAAMAIPKEGYFKEERGRYGPVFPKTPACYGFSVIAKVIPGREEHLYNHAKVIEKAIAENPTFLAPLKAHYLRWVVFKIKDESYMMYQGIFDTDFDKYCEDASFLFGKSGIVSAFAALEGWPEDYATNPAAIVKFFREHQWPSFLEYSEHPYVSCEEIKKGLKLKTAFADVLDLMQ